MATGTRDSTYSPHSDVRKTGGETWSRAACATESTSTSAAVTATVPRGHPRFAQGLRQVSSVDGNAFKTRKYARGRSNFTLQEGDTGNVPQVPAYPSQGAAIVQASATRLR